ncbi:hypothetical protein E1295_30815 [Nonomuraea mesophila]|uniref:Uncharacterized protein n=1 Tax=Nonomuraea mesophila TaxID=2530382 RepID=A0A4R5F1B8_9ACTN|nr:hypothetical protein E1295_30815 [Nonomuraea mesophila]
MSWPYHGIHVQPPEPNHEQLVWSEPPPRSAHVRVRQHLCACQDVAFELCVAGGLMFIRRATRTPDTVLVHETESWRSKRAEDVWTRLVSGEAP